MRVSKRILSMLVIALVVITILLSYDYFDRCVSYKYEVESDQLAGMVLNDHQKDIIKGLDAARNEAVVGGALLCCLILLRLTEPTFKGRIIYI